jgi:SNARE protein
VPLLQIGAEVSDKMKRQTEDITKIKDDVDQVDSNLKRADKQIRMFMRRMATDRIFLVLMLLVVIGLIVAIAVYFMKPKIEGTPVLDAGTSFTGS